MEKIVLYTKSYSGDLERLKVCIESIKQFNEDNIPYYVSVPSNEIEYFKNNNAKGEIVILVKGKED